ncbi:hypothetical protein B296_00056128 [Ensete ventricosum]|uniref:Uncharacterized protein n=1 Tax=Ensete ventricosum TaxID=4639 RepID=A0A426X5T2_ENSVE|nr:hypothetical protein B296_00056128 [Ensete ventricosum]
MLLSSPPSLSSLLSLFFAAIAAVAGLRCSSLQSLLFTAIAIVAPRHYCCYRSSRSRSVGIALAKNRNLASAFAGAEQGTSCSARRSNLKGMVVSETSNGKNAKWKVAPIGQISMRGKS